MNNYGNKVLSQISTLNQRYEENEGSGSLGEGANFEIRVGDVPILVSAPHAVKQLRDGRIKIQDGMTGGIVEYLVGRFGLYGITRIWNANDDPNYADDERSVAYRDKVVEIVKDVGIKWVLDIHGCRDDHGFDIDIGINGGGNLVCDRRRVENLAEVWRKGGLDVRIDGKFTAERLNTVSNYVHRKTGVNCLQLELSEGVRKNDEKIVKFLWGFEKNLSKLLASGGGSRSSVRSVHPTGRR